MKSDVKKDTGITVTGYSEAHLQEWEDFISNSFTGTIFHRQRFLQYHPVERFPNKSLLFYETKNKRLLSIFPASIIENEGQRILKTHPGTSYGGFVFDQKIPLRKVYSILESLEQFCYDNAIDSVEFRQPPKIFNKVYLDQLDYALVQNGYVRQNEELSTFYSLKEFNSSENFDEFIMQFPQKNRNEIRKAHNNGIYSKVVQEDRDVESFYNILCQNLLDKHGIKPVHSLEEIKKLQSLFPKDIFIYGIFKEDVLIGGFLVLQINSRGWHVFYAPIDYNYQDLRPLNLGVAELIQFGIKEKQDILNYGVSTPDSGRKVNWGLLRFKENFNGTGVSRIYWRKAIEK